ncbi:MAG: ATP-grasp domain-containing protein [Dehalococcoidales bacterium]|nr:ATP-grasp domain-containing protein [Dehalococcoidales bacterium]
MKLGLAYDLKKDVTVGQSYPEDALEEYDSLETVDGITCVLESLGHSVVRLGGGREFLNNILHNEVDFIFNISEGRGNYRSREAQVPSVLEMLNIPYSGADPQCLAICLDKPLTNQLVAAAGVGVPRCQVVNNRSELSEVNWEGFPFPAFVKPVHEGSSKGVRIKSRIESQSEIVSVVGALLDAYRQSVMVEEFIAGDEVTVGIVGNRPPAVVGIMRIVPRQKSPNFVYSLEVKRDWERLVEYECPARLEPGVAQKITDFSLKAYAVLGCRDFARIDFRIRTDGTLYFLEINPLAGLNPRSSDLCILAGKVGWSYQALISGILNAGLDRYPQCIRK